jgi:hypothetical protein
VSAPDRPTREQVASYPIDGGVCLQSGCGCIEWDPTAGQVCTCDHQSSVHEQIELPDPLPAPGESTAWLIEITARQRRNLPPEYHRPAFSGLTAPQMWQCSVCWATDGSETTAWPCATVAAGPAAVKLAESLGLEFSW